MADPVTERLRRQLGIADVRLNENTKTLLSLRGSLLTGMRISLHRDLLQHEYLAEDLATWIHARTVTPRLRGAIDAVFARQREVQRATVAPSLETLTKPVDLQATYDRLHRTWFAHLPRIPVEWARERQGRLRAIRFAAFHRQPPRISVNPRVNQPWVAALWVDFLLFHELCHHAQHCRPIAGEMPHSPRFKAWEQRFPHWREAVAWEKANLDRFLAARTSSAAF